MGVSKVIGSDVPNFVKDVPRVPNCVPRWGLAPNHFLMGSKMKSLIIHVHMGVSEVIGLNVANLIKDVSNFVKGVLKVPKFVSKQGTISNHFSKIPKGINKP